MTQDRKNLERRRGQRGHDLLTRALHWATVVFVVLAFTTVWLADALDEDYREICINLHHLAGASVLFLSVPRLVWRLFAPRLPELDPGTLGAMAARAAHLALYAMLMIQPLLGWLYLSARGRPLVYLGLVLPMPIVRNRDLADTLLSLHGTVSSIMLLTIGVHAAAALGHHFVLRDATLMRMIVSRVRVRAAGQIPLAERARRLIYARFARAQDETGG